MVSHRVPRAALSAGCAWCLAITGVVRAGPGPAGGEPAPPAGADSTAVAEIPVGLEDVVGELDLADQPAAWREIVADSGPAGAGARSAAGAVMSWRSAGSTGGLRHDGRLDARSGRLLARATVRLRPGESASFAGAAGAGLGPARFWAGHLDLRHGFGLAGADAGRRGTLAADQSLGGVAGGLVPRTAAGAAAGGLQGGVALEAGRWSLAALAGVPGSRGSGPAWAARAEHAWGGEDRQRLCAVAAGSDSSGSFGSIAGRVASGGLVASGEIAGWRPHAGTSVAAVVGGVAWRPVTPLRLELLSGLATGATRGAAAVLPSGATSGWAARLAWRDRGGGALQLLAQGSRGPVRGTEPRRRALEVVDAAWERRAAAGLTAELRCRRTLRRELAWSDRQPWLPGTEGQPQARTSLQAVLRREARDSRLALQWRAFSVGGSAADGERQALSLSGRRRWRGRWEAWFDATAAWGDPVDLVRALAPLPGLVAARHWGSWGSEALVGGGWRGSGLAAFVAVARRLPDPAAAAAEAPGNAAWEGWLEVRGSW